MDGTAATPEDDDRAAATPDQPVRGTERLVTLDFIRGIAVVGILFANITAFGHPMVAYYWPGALPDGGNEADRWVWLFQFVLIDGKFRTLFTLLFGAGMYLFTERAWARGSGEGLQFRRLVLLLAFGAAHFFFLFIGDILFLYALSGFAALLLLNWGARQQFWTGLIWYLVGTLAFTVALASAAAMEASPAVQAQAGEAWAQMEGAWQGQLTEAEGEREVISRGNYGDIVAYRFTEQRGRLAENMFIAAFETIPLMLIGMALYRFGFFAGGFSRRKMQAWGWIGFVGGGIASLAMGWLVVERGFPPYLTQLMFNGLSGFPRIAMALGMAALLVLWAPRAGQGWLGSRFVAAGRMAFSNYVGTSVVMLFVFQGWAGGLYGELHRLDLLAIAAGGWLLMLAWSKPWLERFRYGPLEWLWRCLTYGKLFPLSRRVELDTATHSH